MSYLKYKELTLNKKIYKPSFLYRDNFKVKDIKKKISHSNYGLVRQFRTFI